MKSPLRTIQQLVNTTAYTRSGYNSIVHLKIPEISNACGKPTKVYLKLGVATYSEPFNKEGIREFIEFLQEVHEGME